MGKIYSEKNPWSEENEEGYIRRTKEEVYNIYLKRKIHKRSNNIKQVEVVDISEKDGELKSK